MLKKSSPAWQLAIKRAKRKNCHSVPVELLPNGNVVMLGIIRGNTWEYSYNDLLLLESDHQNSKRTKKGLKL